MTRFVVCALFAFAPLPRQAFGQSAAKDTPPGVLVDIGGYRLHLHCTGEGSPTVVLEAGAGDFSFDWALVQPAVARVSRVCSYDRAGYAWSDRGPAPRTIRQIVAELHALLHKAGERPPYVLVGHSLGGLLVRVYATEYPADVAGLVLIEATHEDNVIMLNGQPQLLRGMSRGRAIPPPRFEPPAADSAVAAAQAPASPASEVSSPYDRLPLAIQRVRIWASQRQGFAAARASEFDYLPEELSVLHEQRARDSTPLHHVALVVLTRNGAPAGHASRQADLVHLSTNSKQVIASTGDHHVQLGDPAVVITAIEEVVRAARTNRRLDARN